MKVLLVNGSPKANGNTARALAEVAEQLNAEGIDTEVFQLGAKPIRDCIGCGQCGKLGGRCTFDDDVVNELIAAAEQADGFVFGSPVYYAHPSGRILSALDRAFYAAGTPLRTNPAPRSLSPVAAARRPPSMCSTSTSPSTRCPWSPPRTGTTSLVAYPATPMGMPRALPPCATSARTWPGSCNVSKQDRPPASARPKPIASAPTSFDKSSGGHLDVLSMSAKSQLMRQGALKEEGAGLLPAPDD